MAELRPLDLSPAGIEATSQLLCTVYPRASHLTPAYLERLYFGNPLGETMGVTAWDAGRLVAHYLMVPVKARVHGTEELGIAPYQLATHPEHRGKGLFLRLGEEVMEQSRAKGFGYLVGVGNHQSSPIYVHKWNCQAVCQLDVKLGVGPIPRRDESRDESLELVRIWDEKGLAWRLRLAEHPYRVQLAGERGLVFADSGRLGVWAMLGEHPRAWFPSDTKPSRAPALRLWMGVDPGRRWRRSLYFDLPERLKPAPLILLWRDLTGRGRRLDPARVRYDGLDFDAY